MKVRIGVGNGRVNAPGDLGELVDDLDELGFDSIWLSEVLTAPGLDPLVGLAYAAAHNPRIKLGTTMLLPGRNIVRLAKSLASLDALSGGRLLVTLVPGLNEEPERSAIGPVPARRGKDTEEAMPLLRRLLAGEKVEYSSELAQLEGVEIAPLPVQQPLEFWLGGMAPAALERCGRFGDGWLPSLCAPAEALAGKVVIDRAAAAAERTISEEHFGISVAYASADPDPVSLARLTARARGRDLAKLLPVGMDALRALLESFIEVGFSKFVVRPIVLARSWRAELEELAQAVGGLQT